MAEDLDPLGRTPISDGMKAQLSAALATLDPDAKAALLIITDTQTKSSRLHVVANLPGKGWKVAAGTGFYYEDKTRTSGWFAIEKVWK